jgi:hypothetical protein
MLEAGPPPAGVAPWEPLTYRAMIGAMVGAISLRAVQYGTHSHGVRVLVSVLMLVSAIFIVAESLCVLCDHRGALWKISGRPAREQLSLAERWPRNYSPRQVSGTCLLLCVFVFFYGFAGLPGRAAAALPDAFLYRGHSYYETRSLGEPYCFVRSAGAGEGLTKQLPQGFAPLHPLDGDFRYVGTRLILLSNDEQHRPTPPRVFVRDGGCLRRYMLDHRSG